MQGIRDEIEVLENDRDLIGSTDRETPTGDGLQPDSGDRENTRFVARIEPATGTVAVHDKKLGVDQHTPMDAAGQLHVGNGGNLNLREQATRVMALSASFAAAKSITAEKLGYTARTFAAHAEKRQLPRGDHRRDRISCSSSTAIAPVRGCSHEESAFDTPRLKSRRKRWHRIRKPSGRGQGVAGSFPSQGTNAMKARAGMYRTPRDPGGFPFGYNWKATGIGLFLLVGFNLVATQYIAAQFRYQRALGTPLLRMKRTALYQPFAWCIWGFQNCTSCDSGVRRKPLFEGEMIVFHGCILSMLAFFVAANRRAQRLSENAEDLHGSARLAGPEDIEATGIMQTRGGVYVGGWYNNSSRRLQYLRHNGPEHVLAFAPTRSE